jgi:histidine triad (HIT) family protein
MNQTTEKDCPFCKMSEHRMDHVTVLEDKEILTIMDLYPATSGHVLVLPKQHIENIYEMPPDLGAHIMTTVIRVTKTIREKLSPAGINLIQANGAAAGQTVSHFHLHIVPRYENDPVALRFGHGTVPRSVAELERIALLLRSGLGPE